MFLHCRSWSFHQHKRGPPQLNRRSAAERLSRESQETRLEPIGLSRHSPSERSRPFTLNEIMAVIKQQQSRVIEVAARPRWHVEGRTQPVPGVKSGKEALLKVKNSGEPQFCEQRIA